MLSRSLKVFLCHSSVDKPQIRSLYNSLINVGVDVWLDEEKLLPGQDWRMEILSAVRQSDGIIVCLSSNSITKEGFVQKEIKFALDVAEEKPEESIFIIPLRLDECEVPKRLSKWQYVDLFLEDGTFPHKSYELLLKALRMRATQIGIKIEDLELVTNKNKAIESEIRSLKNKLQSVAVQYNLPAINEILGSARSLKAQCEEDYELLAKIKSFEEEIINKRNTIRNLLGAIGTGDADLSRAEYIRIKEIVERGTTVISLSDGTEENIDSFLAIQRKVYVNFLKEKAVERLNEAEGLLKNSPQEAINRLNEILERLTDDILLSEDKASLERHAELTRQKIKEIQTRLGY